ncbi:diacylglycerol kinase family protein [Cohnella lubricantis]|uniref:Diacylglycerol kinase family protein n=2 Tax=Cohnella lubricantis TaxID=2163172 RepID=A0A841THM5_9BACL|nr:diacylglycerol kinase family protein [Cohnella lubricantis]
MKNEPHMRMHLGAAIIVLAAAAWLKLPIEGWLWILSAVAAVWVTELLNTAVERAVDLASPDSNHLAKVAKDAAAGAVLVASLYSAAIGVLVLGPPIWDRLFGG